MAEIEVVRSSERIVFAADATTGMVREEAFSGEGIWAGLVRAAPERASGWHHHGDYDTYIYVASGYLRFEFGPRGANQVEAGPGDFVHVPKHLVHRESNPDSDEGVLIGVRAGSGPAVVNVNGPD
jgi:uncharacterized RmlC-like cupin family protein